jgi:general secretion pathway protein J
MNRFSSGNPRSRVMACAGFTLLELLVAIAILALLSVLGYRALAALTDSEVRLTEEATRWRTLDQLFTRLESDMRQAQPRAVRVSGVNEPAWLGSTDAEGNANLRFSRSGAEFTLEAGSAGQRLGYRFRDGAVEVVYSPYLDIGPETPSTAFVLADGITRFRISYLDPAGGWVDRWPMRADLPLPRAVRVELGLAGGETVERWLTLR